MAHLAVRAMLGIAAGVRQSIALLFVDISCAFASMGRKLVLRETTPDEHWICMLRSSGFTSEEICDIMKSIADCCVLSDAGCSDHLRAVLGDLHERTWFSMEAVSGIACTDRGTQAGTPVSDLLFAIAMGRVFKSVRVAL